MLYTLIPTLLSGLLAINGQVDPASLLFPQETTTEIVAPAWIGCWQEVGGGEVLWFDEGRCGRLRGGEPVFFRTVYTKSGAWLESWARVAELGLELEGGVLLVREGEKVRRFEGVEDVPEKLLVEPYELPRSGDVDVDTIAVLRDDLQQRRAEDQRVRTDPSASGEMAQVDSDNTAFLLAVIQEVGWIDATRFGAEASDAAFLLVQHSSDLRLLRTALPFIQEDVENDLIGGQSFALLFDRLQLQLGYKQRYGSQIGVTEDGKYILMPCEDAERVDDLRAEMGMVPLAAYLSLFEEGGSKVQRIEDVLSPPKR